MVYRLPDERIALDLDGPTVEVQRLAAPGVWVFAVRELEAVLKAKGRPAQMAALIPLYQRFMAEAQPTWDIADHLGPVPVSPGGALRLPVELGMRMVTGWIESFDRAEAEEPSTAVDEMVPPSPLRDQLNAKLREKRKAA